jgi:NAD(P)-dependent dehydrogenase (short-subunit alcohol dehydrogenase family)
MSGSLKQLFDLSGRVAIVTGGSRGLGLQIAEALGEYGARLALVARKQDELDEAVGSLADASIEARGFAADLGNESAPQTVVEQVLATFGRIDILVNNAGATWGARAEDYPTQGWEKVMRLNVSSAFFLTQAVARAAFLSNGGGAVVNIASITALIGHHTGQIGTVAYNTSKGALLSMTRALAAEWGPRNIRVNALAPGYFPSKMTAATLAEHGEQMIQQTPLGRLGGPSDLKGPTLLLASDAGRHITGQYIVVDGGMSIV